MPKLVHYSTPQDLDGQGTFVAQMRFLGTKKFDFDLMLG